MWVDSDRDGIQDEGEPGIPGVTLVLTDARLRVRAAEGLGW
ncbi:SdrD B-like domain-containing protein [Georgenia sunbinii]